MPIDDPYIIIGQIVKILLRYEDGKELWMPFINSMHPSLGLSTAAFVRSAVLSRRRKGALLRPVHTVLFDIPPSRKTSSRA